MSILGAKRKRFAPEVNRLIGVLQALGCQVTHGEPGRGRCERCGEPAQETRFNVCFVCVMLEDPNAEDWEFNMGMRALEERGQTVDRWLRARFAAGFPVVE